MRGTEYDKVEKIGEFLYVRLDSGRRVTFWNALREAEAGKRKVWRWLSRVNKLAVSEYDLEHYEWFVDDIETMLHIHRKALEERRGRRSKEERIAMLRDTAGRNPEEVALFLAKADELERKLGEAGG